jgi:repressor of nif and glnA expression
MQDGMVSSRAPIKGAFSSGFAVSNLVTIVEASKAEVLVPNEFIPVFNVLSFELGA